MTKYDEFLCGNCLEQRKPHQHAVICTDCVESLWEQISDLELRNDVLERTLSQTRKRLNRANGKWGGYKQTTHDLDRQKNFWLDKAVERGEDITRLKGLVHEEQKERDYYLAHSHDLKEALDEANSEIHKLKEELEQEKQNRDQLYLILYEHGWKPCDVFQALQAQFNNQNSKKEVHNESYTGQLLQRSGGS